MPWLDPTQLPKQSYRQTPPCQGCLEQFRQGRGQEPTAQKKPGKMALLKSLLQGVQTVQGIWVILPSSIKMGMAAATALMGLGQYSHSSPPAAGFASNTHAVLCNRPCSTRGASLANTLGYHNSYTR